MTANDSDVSDGDILTGSQVVRVYGENLTAPFVTLTFGDVEYTPLSQGEGYIEYILGDNGTATINVDGNQFMSFEVEGVVVPEGFPTTIQGQQNSAGGASANVNLLNNVNCMNYPYRATEEYSLFKFTFGGNGYDFIDTEADNWSCYGGVIDDIAIFQNVRTRLTISPQDNNSTAWLLYKGFIVAVFNYTTD